MEKAKLREMVQQQRGELPEQTRKRWDDLICEALWQQPVYSQVERMMIYLSFGSEINTWPLVRQALADGKQVFVPKVRKYPKEIIAVELTDMEDLKPGLWGIYEPVEPTASDPLLLELVVVPGMAFNRQGFRLGYGGGYYDRFLPQTDAYRIGLCYEMFIMDIPVMPWDQPVNLILGEGNQYRC